MNHEMEKPFYAPRASLLLLWLTGMPRSGLSGSSHDGNRFLLTAGVLSIRALTRKYSIASFYVKACTIAQAEWDILFPNGSLIRVYIELRAYSKCGLKSAHNGT
jgi:hypothetical protein